MGSFDSTLALRHSAFPSVHAQIARECRLGHDFFRINACYLNDHLYEALPHVCLIDGFAFGPLIALHHVAGEGAQGRNRHVPPSLRPTTGTL